MCLLYHEARKLLSLGFFGFLAFVVLGGGFIGTEASGQSGSVLRDSQRGGAMDLPEGRLGRVLARYFEEGIGGLEAFERLESLRLEGTITLDDRELSFQALKKKPDLFKLTINLPNRQQWIMAHDGREAWQRRPDVEEGAAHLLSEEAKARFMIDTAFASHLLFPRDPSKTVEFIDTIPIDGRVCHQIRVRLESGFTLTYFIDIREFHEYKVITESPDGEDRSESIFENFERIQGVPIARRVTNFEGGEKVSVLNIDRVEANMGIMPWMFEKPVY